MVNGKWVPATTAEVFRHILCLDEKETPIETARRVIEKHKDTLKALKER